MMKRLCTLALAATFLGVAGSALAQTDVHKPVGLSIRLGAFIPTDDNTRKVNNTWFAFGVDYKLTDRMVDRSSDVLSVSLDYASNNNFRTVPLLVNLTRHTDPFYVSGGLGVAFTRLPMGGGIEDRPQFAFQVGVGYEFHTADFPLFVEARFWGNARSQLNGFVVYAGARF